MVRWIKDEQAESAMMEMSLRFNVRAIDAGEIDEKASLQNRGRDERLCSKNAEAIARGAMGGTPVPMIVVSPMKTGMYKIVSGNHRFFGLRDVGVVRFEVYVVACDELEFGQLAFQLNTNHGRPIDEQTRMDRAIELVELYGLTHEDAGRRCGLSRSAVGQAIRDSKARGYIEAVLPKNVTNKIPRRVADKLRALRDDDLVRRLSEYAAGPASEYEKWQAVKLVAEETDRDKRVEMIEGMIPKKVEGVKRPIRVAFMRNVSSLENLLHKHGSYASLQVEPETVEVTRQRVLDLGKKLKGLTDE